MITLKLNLTQLKHVRLELDGKSGKVDGLFIPIKANEIFASEKGNVYLDVVAFEMKEKKYDDTHILKQSLPKERRDAMSKEEKEAMPVLGHMRVSDGFTEAAPNTPETKVYSSDDDIPF